MSPNNSTIGGDFTNPGTDYLDAVLAELTDPIGAALFGLFIAAFVFLMLYYAADGRIGVPAIVMTLAGAWLVGEIPAQYRSAVEVIIIVGIAAGVWAISKRYFLNPTR